jgi:hypothetical protein
MSYRQHALRRLNPFRGISRVVDGVDARAVSTDGVNWELQMLGQRPAGWGSLNAGRTETHHYRYGVWSAQEGLALYPGNRTREQSLVEDIARRLIEVLTESSDPGGLEISDSCECWLLDAASRQPLALLGAVATAAEIPQRSGSRWRAAPGDDESLAGFGRERAAALERLVAQRGGRQAWFERTADGSGKEVGAGATAILPRDAFPELLLDEIWPAADRALVSAYFDWLAPRLLMLSLTAETRARLEPAAAQRADEVAKFFRLFPTVIDSVLMNSLRVQARLQQSLA